MAGPAADDPRRARARRCALGGEGDPDRQRTHYFPAHLLALSCSSPFWESEDTGLASARTKVFEVMPTAGLPPRLDDWSEFEQFLDALIRAGSISTVREVVGHPAAPRVRHGRVAHVRRHSVAAGGRGGGRTGAMPVTWFDDLMDAGAPVRCGTPGWCGRTSGARPGMGWRPRSSPTIAATTGRWWTTLLELVEQLRPIADRLGCRTELDSIRGSLPRVGPIGANSTWWPLARDLRDVVAQLALELRDGPQP